jgi:hypothetical protein
MTVASDQGNQPWLQVLSRPVSLERFLAWYPENSGSCYELRRGVIVEMPKPCGKHSEIAGFIHDQLAFEIRRLQLNYFIPKECSIAPRDSVFSLSKLDSLLARVLAWMRRSSAEISCSSPIASSSSSLSGRLAAVLSRYSAWAR